MKAAYMKKGDMLEIQGDCPTLERDVRVWCKRLNKALISINMEEQKKIRMLIQF